MIPDRIPTEREEQMIFVRYLEARRLPFFRVPNETFTRSWKQKNTNKLLGVKPGVPDMFVCVNGRTIAIEMKRLKGGQTSPYQKEWLAILQQHGVAATVCKGAAEAIKFVESFEG